MSSSVVIVGAGPIGCVAAIALSKQGRAVTLLERRPWAQVKPPYLSGVGAPLRAFFDQFDLMTLIDAATVNRGRHFELCCPSGARFEANWGPECGRLLFERRPVDLALRERVKRHPIQIYDRVGGLSLLTEGDRVRGVSFSHAGQTRSIHSALVLGCDGSHSTVARLAQLKERPQRFQHLYHGRTFSHASIRPDHFGFYPSTQRGLSTLLFAESKPGRVYVEMETQLHRGLSAAGRAEQDQRFQATLKATPALNTLLKDAKAEGAWTAITRRSVERDQISRPGLLLLGDAAHTSDPISSAGLLTGLLGVEVLLKASGPPWHEASIAQRYRAEIHDIHRFSVLFRALLNRPTLLTLGVPLINRLGGTKARLLSPFNGQTRHADLLSARGLLGLLLNRAPDEPTEA